MISVVHRSPYDVVGNSMKRNRYYHYSSTLLQRMLRLTSTTTRRGRATNEQDVHTLTHHHTVTHSIVQYASREMGVTVQMGSSRPPLVSNTTEAFKLVLGVTP